ncbi:hypothetical protein AAFP35_12915 [Gordonia sp. CPCC 206044]|uniref:DUF6928 family protein n=1 Tax=Gordonia sp. CPCC 206044 TaxID=3140793 RepID=UPI003AF404BA
MSSRAVTLWFIDVEDPVGLLRSGPANDVASAQQLADPLYRNHVLVPLTDTDLASAAGAQDPHVYAGSYGGLAVLSCSLFATSEPSNLTRTIASIRRSRATTLLYTDPDKGLGVFAQWENGSLRRSFAADPVTIVEDTGLPFAFERPFWAGDHPLRYAPGVVPEMMALPFHPQELAEQSNREWLGFRFTPPLAETDHDPARIPVTAFAIHPADYVPGEEDWTRYRELSQARPTAPDDVTQAESNGHTPVRRKNRVARYFGF